MRAEISDQAGNVAKTQTTVRDNGPASGSGTNADKTNPDGTAPTVSVQRPSSGPANGSANNSTAGPAWPIDHVTNQTVGQSADATAGPALNGGTANSNNSGGNNAGGNDHGPTFGPMLASTDPPTSPIASPINPPVENRFYVAGSGGNSIFTQGLPAGERPYMVNSRRFALDYVVESAGSAGIAKIEIWGTRDAGRSWQSFGVQPATHGPIKVKVDSEGLYGFRITVVDGKGLTRGRRMVATCQSYGSASI